MKRPGSDDGAALEDLRQTFGTIAGEDRLIDLAEFKGALKLKDEILAARVFSIFDTDGSGTISTNELIRAVEALTHGTNEEKLGFAFSLHDGNGDGLIQENELSLLIKTSLAENKLRFTAEQVDALVNILFRQADADRNGHISFDEFVAVFGRHADLLEGMAISPVHWLRPRRHVRPGTSPRDEADRRWREALLIRRYLENNWLTITFLLLYAAANAFLFFGAVQRYADAGANAWIQIARGCGTMLNLNGALIALPMLRSLISWLRGTPVSGVLPLDHSLEFHKLVGHVMFAAAIVHTIAHLANYAALPAPFYDNLLFTWAGLSGTLLLLVFTGMWVTALPRVRMGGHFRLFYLAHLAYVLWFGLLLVHSPNFWKWALVPLLAFVVERVLRLRRTRNPTFVVNAKLLPSKVLALEIQRPEGFDYQPGDYLYLKCPHVSRFEWHPFSISSAPEDRQILKAHIRTVGAWSGRMYHLFESRRDALARNPAGAAARPIPVYVDGPYGTPSRHIFDAENAVLVAAGIGVTPFSSILQSIRHRKRDGAGGIRLKKVHFFWLNREQESFEWFTELLSRLEEEDREGFFDFRIYLTGAQERTDLKSGTLFIAMDMLHSETRVDLITGLRTKTRTGRPDWESEFGRIAREHGGNPVTVFYCGPPGLTRVLRRVSARYGFGFRREQF